MFELKNNGIKHLWASKSYSNLVLPNLSSLTAKDIVGTNVEIVSTTMTYNKFYVTY